MSNNVFQGCMPALMTPCNDDRRPDFDALVRKGKALVDAGMSAVIYCGSMGDWPLLTDEQRMTGVSRLIDAGIPVVVGTGAVNTRSAAILFPVRNQRRGRRCVFVLQAGRGRPLSFLIFCLF